MPLPPEAAQAPTAAFLARLGATGDMADALLAAAAPSDKHRLGRVAEDRGVQYIVAFDPESPGSEALAECAPTLLRDFRRGEGPRPVVGDWVWTLAASNPKHPHEISHLLPRSGAFSRLRPHSLEEQVLAANADYAFLLAAVGPDFNPRRIERYLAAAAKANARAVVVLAKVDLTDSLAPFHEALAPLVSLDRVIDWSAVTLKGIEALRACLAPGHTAALLGSSGVGKSTLINRLIGEELLNTTQVRRDGKGRHTTTRRQLVPLESGGVIIDTPGIRELALFDADAGVAETFDDVQSVAQGCKFNDCKHAGEPGCAIAIALAKGELAFERVASFLKLREELADSAKQRSVRRRGPKLRSNASAKGAKPTPRRARKRRNPGQDE